MLSEERRAGMEHLGEAKRRERERERGGGGGREGEREAKEGLIVRKNENMRGGGV